MRNVFLKKIREYFSKQPGVKLVYLYGSQAKGEARKDSDIDLAVLFENKKRLNTFTFQAQFMADLSLLLGEKVEVQNLNACDVSFAYRVISEGSLVYSKNTDDKTLYETYISRQHFDLKPSYDEYFSLLAERAKKGLIGEEIYRYKQ